MYKRYSGRDRRRYQRLDLNITVIYTIHEPPILRMQFGDEEIEAVMLNLSEGGMGLVTSYDLPVHTLLFIKLTLSRMDEDGQIAYYGPMEIMGEVRSNVISEQKERRLGISFTRIDLRAKEDIRNFVKMTLK